MLEAPRLKKIPPEVQMGSIVNTETWPGNDSVYSQKGWYCRYFKYQANDPLWIFYYTSLLYYGTEVNAERIVVQTACLAKSS